jgi:hypothetical protein
MVRKVMGNDSRSERERIMVGMSRDRRVCICSWCTVITSPWLDKTASITSKVEVGGMDENRTKAGFSPVTRRLRSLKTC